MRDPLYVPENKKLDDLLNEFKSKKIHMAIVVDEYGGTSGLITLEDVMEEIFGELNDEFDQDDSLFSKLDENTFIFDAKINLPDFYKALELKDFSSFEKISRNRNFRRTINRKSTKNTKSWSSNYSSRF